MFIDAKRYKNNFQRTGIIAFILRKAGKYINNNIMKGINSTYPARECVFNLLKNNKTEVIANKRKTT